MKFIKIKRIDSVLAHSYQNRLTVKFVSALVLRRTNSKVRGPFKSHLLSPVLFRSMSVNIAMDSFTRRVSCD